MHKINRSEYCFGTQTIPIITAPPPPPEPENDEVKEVELSEEEKAAIAEKKRLEEERIRFENTVDERVNEIINAQREAINNESRAILSKARAEAKELVGNAEKTAGSMLMNARREGEELKETCRREGYADGFAEGKKEAQEKAMEYLEACGQFLEQINARKESYFISNEEELRQTLTVCVEKIVLEKLRKNDKVVERIVGRAAKDFRNSDFVKISVMGGEVSKEFRTNKEYVKAIAEGIADVEVELLPEDEYPEGTVILDNGSEIIDASVPTQLEFLKEIVRNNGEASEEN